MHLKRIESMFYCTAYIVLVNDIFNLVTLLIDLSKKNVGLNRFYYFCLSYSFILLFRFCVVQKGFSFVFCSMVTDAIYIAQYYICFTQAIN